MIKTVELKIPLDQESSIDNWPVFLAKQFNLDYNSIEDIKLKKRSIDARSRTVMVFLRFDLGINEKLPSNQPPFVKQSPPSTSEVHIIGCGPAGLFAALECINQGLKPIVFERGKDVRQRRRDLAKLTKEQVVDPNSNYCFGEGGAGTYSDGKLYTRSKKRGDVQKVLEGLVQFGADENILYNSHPHIGTNKLPHIIVAIREYILQNGGEIHFNSKLTDLEIKNDTITAITINNKTHYPIQNLILATGHSARDIFTLLHSKNIKIEAKPFALGVRVEHPQEFVNKRQYKANWNHKALEAASYSLVAQVNQHGVYSFCMCPGGIIAPCATQEEEIVTNGWSPSKRNNPYANSGIVVTVNEKDWSKHKSKGPLAAMHFQSEIEKRAFTLANPSGKGQKAPAQRLVDFIKGKKSENLPNCSYHPGVVSVNMKEVLPREIANSLVSGFISFDKKIKGFLHPDAIIVGVESRTSSPVSIPRDRISLKHIEINNLYPCGEGAGYAGGIVSAAIDGMNCATKIKEEIGD